MVFDKKVTSLVKGIAIIMMLIHHVFAPEMLQKFNITTNWISLETLSWISNQLRICVAIFVFLSAFGIAKQMPKVVSEKNNLFSNAIKRYIKLEANFIIIYILGFVGHLVFGEGVLKIYNVNDDYLLACIYGVIDMLGLHNLFGTPTLNVTWWYMTAAFLIIFLAPICTLFYRKIGTLLLAVFFFASFNINPAIGPYLLVLIVGVWAAEENILERIYSKVWVNSKWYVKCITVITLLVSFPALLWIRKITGFTYWIDAMVPIIVCVLGMIIKNLIPLVPVILEFLGKHSMNIFLCHTFIYYYFFDKLVYRFSNWIVIFVILLSLSLLLSIVVETIKNITGFYKLVNFSEKRKEND